MGIQISPEILNRQFATAWKAKKNFGHSMADWSDLVDQTFAGLTDKVPSASFFPDLYNEFTKPEAWRIFDDVIPCLKRLKERGLKLGAISNWDERLRPLLNALNLDRYFDVIVVSAEVGHPKPALKDIPNGCPTIKRHARISILHLGDSPVEDLKGALGAGFKSLLFSPLTSLSLIFLIRHPNKPVISRWFAHLPKLFKVSCSMKDVNTSMPPAWSRRR